MYFKTLTILLWLVGSYLALLFRAPTVWQIVPLSISLGLAMAALGFNIQHDGNHGGYSAKPWVNAMMAMTLDLAGGSSYVWRWKHNVLHHTYSNIAHIDSDTDVGFFARLTPGHTRRKFHRFQHLYLWVLYSLLLFKWQFVDDFANLITGRIGTQRFPRPNTRQLLGILVLKALYFTWAIALPLWLHPTGGVVFAYVVTAAVAGLSLALVFQLAHCHGEADFPLPDSSGRMAVDWATHQVATTVDFARESRFVTWALGGLNLQVEHHLFPRVCHVHYLEISRIVETTCRDFGLTYRFHDTFTQALVAHSRWLRRMGVAPEFECG